MNERLRGIGAQVLALACAPLLVVALGMLTIWLALWSVITGNRELRWWNGTTNEGGKRG